MSWDLWGTGGGTNNNLLAPAPAPTNECIDVQEIHMKNGVPSAANPFPTNPVVTTDLTPAPGFGFPAPGPAVNTVDIDNKLKSLKGAVDQSLKQQLIVLQDVVRHQRMQKVVNKLPRRAVGEFCNGISYNVVHFDFGVQLTSTTTVSKRAESCGSLVFATMFVLFLWLSNRRTMTVSPSRNITMWWSKITSTEASQQLEASMALILWVQYVLWRFCPHFVRCVWLVRV